MTYTYREFLFDTSMYHDGASDPFIIQDLKQLLKRCRESKQLGGAKAEIAEILQALLSKLDHGKVLSGDEIDYIRSQLAEVFFLAYCVKRPPKLTLYGEGWNILAEKMGLRVKTVKR